MRNIILTLTFILSITLVFGQKNSVFFFDEFSVSINRTSLKDNNTNDKFGFGLGAYHALLESKKVNLIFGFEYNRTSQLKQSMYEGHFAHSTDVTYYINCLSIPLTARINFGNRIKFFISTGPFLYLSIGARQKGTMHTSLPNVNNQLVYKEFEFDGKADISSLNYGISLGIGINIPISKVNLIIMPDYKFGVKPLYDYHDQILNRYFRLMIGIKI